MCIRDRDDDEEESGDKGIPIWATLNGEQNTKGTYAEKVRYGRPVYQQKTNTREYTRQNNERYNTEVKRCYWCNKVGHFKRECRKYNGWCLGCGSNEHQTAECGSRRGPRQHEQGYRRQDQQDMGCLLYTSDAADERSSVD